MLKMSNEMIEEVFDGDYLKSVIENFGLELESIFVNKFVYDSDRDTFKIDFSMEVKTKTVAEISDMEDEDIKKIIEIMEEESNDNEIVSPEEIFGDEILGRE